MIKLFITDLDGCISLPFQTPAITPLTRIKELSVASREETHIPSLTICSGRPLPYVEAVSQLLDMRQPMIFESGGGIYDMLNNVIHWHPAFDGEREKELRTIRTYVQEQVIDQYKGVIPEFTKRTDVGMVFQNEELIHELLPGIQDHVDTHFPHFEVHHTEVSINIISKGTNKGEGIRHLCELCDLDLSEVAYIGDTGGDIPGLSIVGRSYAPKNAIQKVRETAAYPLESSVTEAVLEAYEDCIRYNEELIN